MFGTPYRKCGLCISQFISEEGDEVTKSRETELVRMTQQCWQHYWQLDMNFMLSYCDESVTWIGAEQSEFIRGLEELKQNFAELLLHLRPCHLLNQEFYVTQSSKSSCTVIGRYMVTTDETNDYFLQAQQRCTFVWQIQDQEYKIMHIHVSNPMGELKVARGERFVNTVGYMANKYLENNFKKRFFGKQITVTDENGAVRFIYLSEIMYVKAQRNDLIIVMTNEQICVKMNISVFMKLTDNTFIKVHRSYAINTAFMAKLERYAVTMKNGEQIPVPVKKYNEVRDRMVQMHNGKKKNRGSSLL